MSITLNMVGGGSAELEATDAVLRVQAPAGAIVTISKGTTTKSDAGHENADDSSVYDYYFIIHQSQFDSVDPWTAVASLNGKTASKTIIINIADEYDLVLDELLSTTYQRVEYLQSSGTQAINTGVYYSDHIEIDVDFMWTALTHDTDIIGAEGGNAYAIVFNVYDNNKNRLIVGTTTGTSTSGQSYATNTRYYGQLYTETHTWLYINGEQWNYDGDSVTSNYPLGLFCRNANGTLSNKASCRIYSCKITKSGTLERNFIPCYRKADTVAGMYDIVHDVFYTNQGSGTFVVGSDVG